MRRMPAATPDFADDLEQADVAGALHVGAAAEFGGEVPDAEHAHVVAVLLAEQGHGAGFHGFVVAHHAGTASALARICSLTSVRWRQLVRRSGLEVGEVEAQLVGRDQRALLRDMRAEHLAQRGVQQMRGGVVEGGRGAGLGIDRALSWSPT
jgi:hypothetical protein